MTDKRLALIILDGFGVRADRNDNAIAQARAPRMHELWSRCPMTELGASGPDVGLPEGQMGNSEVGHLNLGAGRIAQMDISRIDCAVADGTLGTNPAIAEALSIARDRGGRLHLLGLVSDGGVHSSLEHLLALVDAAAAAGVEVVVHAFLDGRDTPPQSAQRYLAQLEARLAGKGTIGTVAGRFWAMDRDRRWDRVQRAYDAIVAAKGHRGTSAREVVDASYAAKITDEFVEPAALGDYAGVEAGRDTALFFNFRADRARELTEALALAEFHGFDRGAERVAPFARYVCMTTFDEKLGLPVAFGKIHYENIFGQILAGAGLAQFRCAETEKFAHVTFFFNGGQQDPFPREERELVPSPREVTTYDQKPEMSAGAVTEAVVRAITSERFPFVLVNFANPDMVGHSGMLGPAVAAVEAVDQAIGAIVDAAREHNFTVLITADHGNCELMRDQVTGEPHTAHTTNPVPFVLVDPAMSSALALRPGGRLCDVAPTMLALLGLPQPAEMTGQSLLA